MTTLRNTLVALGGLMLVLTAAGLRLQRRGNLPWFVALALAQGIVYVFAVWVLFRSRPRRGALALILVIAALLRLVGVLAPPFLSDDIYRYVWDGRVQAAGINPYRFVPADESLAHLRDQAIYPNINRRDYAHTIYPPLAQAIFFAATRVSYSVIWMKLTMVAFEAVVAVVLIKLLASAGQPGERVLVYLWHPLALWEFAGSGHIDAAALMFLVLALWARKREQPALTGIALAGATLVKLYPIVLFPALYRKGDWKMPAALGGTIIAGYLPYLSVGAGVLGFLPGYAEQEGLTRGWSIFLLNLAQRALRLPELGLGWYLLFAVVALLAVSLWALRQTSHDSNTYIGATLILAIAFTALLSPHYSWYFLWLVPLLCLETYTPALYLTLVSFVLYEALLQTSGPVLFRLNALLYVPMAMLALISLLPRVAALTAPNLRETQLDK